MFLMELKITGMTVMSVITGQKIISSSMYHLNLSSNFDFQDVSILDIKNNLVKRLTLEMLHITRNENKVNFRTDIEPIISKCSE